MDINKILKFVLFRLSVKKFLFFVLLGMVFTYVGSILRGFFVFFFLLVERFLLKFVLRRFMIFLMFLLDKLNVFSVFNIYKDIKRFFLY